MTSHTKYNLQKQSHHQQIPRSDPITSDIQEQIERRREHACAEILKIANRGSHPVFSLFEVSSVSGRAYRVEIHSLDELQNSCTCPDYKNNLIGTCRHIEGVLISLEKEHGKKLKKLAAERSKGTQIYLHHATDITVRVALPILTVPRFKDLLNRYFDPSGLLVGARFKYCHRSCQPLSCFQRATSHSSA